MFLSAQPTTGSASYNRICSNVSHSIVACVTPTLIAGLTKLEKLDLRCCRQVSDHGMTHLATLTALETLSIQECHQISSYGVTLLANLPLLHDLHLQAAVGNRCRQVCGSPEGWRRTRISYFEMVRCSIIRFCWLLHESKVMFHRIISTLFFCREHR